MNDFNHKVNNMLNAAPATNKSYYLIQLSSGKPKYFISTNKPDVLNSVIQAKGIFSNAAEEHIVENFSSMISTAKKEEVMEMMFPWHRVAQVRSLVFRAK